MLSSRPTAARLTAEQSARQVALRAEQIQLKTRLPAELARQAAARQAAPAALLPSYDRLRVRRGGRAVALLDGEECSACKVAVSPQDLEAARFGEEPVHCGNCGRLLGRGRGRSVRCFEHALTGPRNLAIIVSITLFVLCAAASRGNGIPTRQGGEIDSIPLLVSVLSTQDVPQHFRKPKRRKESLMSRKLSLLMILVLLAGLLLVPATAGAEGITDAPNPPAARYSHRLIVELSSPPLALYGGGSAEVAGGGRGKLDVASPDAQQYIRKLQSEQQAFVSALQTAVPDARVATYLDENGQSVPATYQAVFNGMAVDAGRNVDVEGLAAPVGQAARRQGRLQGLRRTTRTSTPASR